jgi:hypothetical protein
MPSKRNNEMKIAKCSNVSEELKIAKEGLQVQGGFSTIQQSNNPSNNY